MQKKNTMKRKAVTSHRTQHQRTAIGGGNASSSSLSFLLSLLALLLQNPQQQQSHAFVTQQQQITPSTKNLLISRQSISDVGVTRTPTTSTSLSAAAVGGGGGSSAADDLSQQHQQRRRWHRRVWSKIVGRGGDSGRRSSSAAPLHASSSIVMTADMIEQENDILLDTIALFEGGHDDGHRNNVLENHQNEFILSSFEDDTPLTDILPRKNHVSSITTAAATTTSLSTPVINQANEIDSEYFDISITPAISTTTTTTTETTDLDTIQEEEMILPSSSSRSISLPRLLAMLFENIVTGRIIKHSTQIPEGLSVQVSPLDNTLGRLFTRFRFMADVSIVSTDRLVFPNIRFSRGQLIAKQMTINLLGFLQSRSESSIKYPKQFDLELDGLVMTRNDVMNSSCIRNGLRELLVRILKDRGVQSSSIQITSIDILSSGKISCKGEARTKIGSAPLPFEVRTGLSFESRGHVLTFPGLEVSLARDLGLFVPILPAIDLDVGHNAVFRRLDVDGKNKQITLDATVTITPDRTLQLLKDYEQGSEAYAARFFYDVGRWLTRLGNFTR